MLVAKNVGLRIGAKWLVRNVSFEIETGEFVVLIGANGAGKTTLLRLLAGEIKPTEGTILLDDKSIYNVPLKELAVQRSVMRQQADMNFDFTALEVIAMGRYPYIGKSTKAENDRIIEMVLQQTQTTALQDRIFTTLSGGEKARVTLARVLAQKARYILMDEPTSAMDLQHQRLTMEIARDSIAQGQGVIAILHDLNLASMYADRIGMIHQGQLFAIGTPDEVLTEQNIETVFNVPVRVTKHPDHDVPLIIASHRKNLG